jgi:protein gp37
MSKTTIEWTDYTFNPWWGCAKVSPGCKNCYAETFDKRVGGDHWGIGKPRRTMSAAYWRGPVKWNADAEKGGVRRRVFCASMADVFDPEAPEGLLEQLWQLIAETPNLDWLILTKRPERARKWITTAWPNVWLGTSVESQKYADERIPELMATPAVIRFLSCEPLLEPVDVARILGVRAFPLVQWVIVGGESGHEARPFDPAWARSLVDQCRRVGITPFVKQMGQNWDYDANAAIPRPKRMREIHGRDMDEWPEDIRVREWPLPDGRTHNRREGVQE